MPGPQPVRELRRPPLTASGSLTSMNGRDESPPPFKDFVARTSPISDDRKPLPPQLPWSSRAYSNSPPRSRTRSRVVGRRSSSIYSRTVSQWDSDNFSWRSADFADDPVPPVPPIPPFRTLRYSLSTPHLVKNPAVAPQAPPRTFSPLIRTPSPTSKENTPGFAPDNRTTVWPSRGALSPTLWPGTFPTPPPTKKHVRTISLEEAKAVVHAPGAIHLLPEEHRAKNLRRSKSDEALRVAPLRILPRPSNIDSIEPPTLIDNQGRRRTLLSPADTHPIATEYPFPLVPSTDRNYFKVGIGPERHMIPLATQQREASRDKATQALGIGEFDEPRGRTRHRGPRRLDYIHYMPGSKARTDNTSPEDESEAQKLAKEYHNLLSEQYRRPSVSSGYHSAGSDDKVKTYMKMVPQPLFQTMPPPKLSGDLTRDNGMRASSTGTSRSSGGSTFRSRDGDMVPLKLSVSLQSGHSRQTTSGTIPISPPQPLLEGAFVPILNTPSPLRKKTSAPGKKPKDSRVSAYYPHVAPRKGPKARKASNVAENDSDIPPMPFLSSPVDSEEASSLLLEAKPSVRKDSAGKLRKKSDASSSKGRSAIHKRLMKGAANIITNLERSEESESGSVKAVAVQGSPHLIPAPVSAKSKEVHLGWSDVAKSTFDNLLSPGGLTPPNSSPRSGASQYAHVIGPPRPLDTSRAVSSEPDSPRRKSSVFGGFMGSWKESKAEKRREELKKLIKYVPQEHNTSSRRTSVVFVWM